VAHYQGRVDTDVPGNGPDDAERWPSAAIRVRAAARIAAFVAAEPRVRVPPSSLCQRPLTSPWNAAYAAVTTC
jgi:hypothetical protein